MLVEVSIAPGTEHAALDRCYREWGYRGGIAPDDVVFVARRDSQPIGLVRRAVEHELTMLRGMYVHPHCRGRGVGTQLLAAFIHGCPAADCYCLPFMHLASFYGQAGFAEISEPDTPPVLLERLQRYRAAGHDVCVMCRPVRVSQPVYRTSTSPMVRLRPIAAADAAAVAAAVAGSRDALRRWMPWYSDAYDVHTAGTWIEDAVAAAAAGTAQHFAILDAENDLVGVIGLEDLNQESGRAMIGYWLATRAVGRGIGRRAVELALDWARTQASIRVVWAVAADANVASRRVLEVNRFKLVGSRGTDERSDVVLLYELELHQATV